MDEQTKPPSRPYSHPDAMFLLGRAQEKVGIRFGNLQDVREGRRTQKEADEQAVREGLTPPSSRLKR